MDDKMNMLKETLGEDGLDRLAGLSDKCFFIKKEDFEKTFGQNLIDDGNILMANNSHFIPVDLTSDTTTLAEEPRRSFRCSCTIVDKQEERYNAQMLVVCVLPVFGKSLFPVTPPHLPFRLADGYTTLYRNRHNFFYAAMRNLFSHSFSEKSEEEQLFERLEIAQEFGNYEYNPLLTSDSIAGQQGENKKKRI